MSLIVSPRTGAEWVLDKYWNWKAPVDVKAIAKNLSIQVIELGQTASGNSVSCFKNFAGKKVIAYNPSETEEQIRFSIAHGIGHWVMGHAGVNHLACNKASGCFSPDCNDEREVNANEFAKLLLLPPEAIKFFTLGRGISDITELSNLMGVSESLMHIRLTELGELNVD